MQNEKVYNSWFHAYPKPLVVINDLKKVVEVNPKSEKKFGYHKDEFVGMDLKDLISKKAFKNFEKALQKFLQSSRESNRTFEVLLVDKQGNNFLETVEIINIKDNNENLYFLSINNKIPFEERLELLTQITNVIPWEADFNTFQFTYVGDQAVTTLGYPLKDWYTKDFWPKHIYPDDKTQALDFCLASSKTQKDYVFDYRMIAKSGKIVWLHDIVNVVWKNNLPVLLRGYMVDITERKKNELEIQKLNEQLEQRVAERTAELATTVKDIESFSYSVSHDLRAPLRVIDGFSSMILKKHGKGLDEEGKSLLSQIRENVQKMGSLINDLLALSRLGRQEIKKSSFSMDELAALSVREVKRSNEYKGEVIIHQLPDVNADYGLINQVLVNLVSNGLKYSSKKEKPVVEIGANEKENEIVFFVKDNGAGFDMKYVNKLFKVFERLHNIQEFEGSGIGLAIVKKIVSRHGGKVWAEGKPNEGATFYFSLPKK